MIYVYVRRNSDGCTRMWKANDWHPHTLDLADWKDGKYSCDCEREKFFAWAAGEDEPAKLDVYCNTGGCSLGQFSILLMDAAQQIIYLDDNWVGVAA